MKDTFWKVAVVIFLIVILTLGTGLFIVQGAKNTAISYEEQVAAAQSAIHPEEDREPAGKPQVRSCSKAPAPCVQGLFEFS